jgi:hypothetical protein
MGDWKVMPQLHPLAQAFLASYEGGKQRIQNQQRMHLAETKELEDQKFREQQAEEVKKRVEEQFKQKDAEMELRAKAFKLEEDKYRNLLTQQALADIIAGRKKYNNWTDQAMSQVGQMGKDGKYNIVEPDRFVDPVSGIQLDRSQVGTPESVGQAARDMQAPLLDYKFGQQKELLGVRGEQQNELEGIRAKARAKIEADRQAAADRRNRETNSVRLTLGQLRSQRAAAQKDPNDRLLTLAEIRELPNANFGDTVGMHAGSRPVKPLSDSEQNKITVLKGIGSRIAEVEELAAANPNLFKEAHSKLGTGNAKAWIEGKLNNANPHVSRYREIIGELFSKESLETAGKALTKTELDRLLKWAVDLGNNPTQAKSRLGALKKNTVEMIDSVLTAPQHPKVGGDKPEEIMVEGKKFILNKTTGRYREAGQ